MPDPELPQAPHTIQDWFQGYEEGGVLRGFRCGNCGLITATWSLACPRCGKSAFEETQLGTRGRVIAYTILSVPGDDFLNDAPYCYAVVELDGGGRITGWLPSVRSPPELAIGDRVRFAPSYKPGVQFVKEGPPAPS
jgi:uncharacterized OB-fold protein